jgi:Tol biopolymer transport system component/DNA-binding winged helix-turn-helix (wHTH) protein
MSSTIRFGIFEVDPDAGELRRQGMKVKLQEQPFQVLIVLLERPGELVSREELQKKLWPADTFVDFERGLNRGINKLREALADDAESPRFIETLPRRGYRFMAPVETAGTAIESETPLAAPTRPAEGIAIASPPPGRQNWRWIAAVVLVVVLAVVASLAFWGSWRARPATADRPLLQFDLDAGSDDYSQPVISRDGMSIVLVSKGALEIRRLDQGGFTPINGTQGASLPFFSPDGRWLAFFSADKLQKIAVEGGSPVNLCDAPHPGGGFWGDDDVIVASLNGPEGLSSISAGGGVPKRLTDPKSDSAGATIHLWPQTLPSGRGVLFAATNGSKEGSLRVRTSKDGKVRTVVEHSTFGRYLDSGYLVYYQRGTLFSARLDLDRLELSGSAVPLAFGVSSMGLGRADFDLSANGTLVYRGGASGTRFTVSWLSPSGKIEALLTKPGNYFTPRLSPDGTRVALSVVEENKQNLWVYDIARETLTRLTSGAEPDLLPAWTPDGEYLAFRSGNTLAWTRSDGSGKVERLAVGNNANAGPWSFSASGKWLAFWPLQPRSDLWTVPVERSPGSLHLGQPHQLLEQPGSKGAPAISPDDRWLAYTSDETGQFEIYVIPFSPQGKPALGKWTISSAGGVAPKWSRDGHQLFFQDGDHRVQVAGWSGKGNSFAAEKPKAWSEVRLGDTGIFPVFDVAPDGKRVLALFAPEDPRGQTLLHVILNVDSELLRHAQ